MNEHTPTPWRYHLGRGKFPRFHIQTEGGYQIASTPELDSLSKEENEGREETPLSSSGPSICMIN